MVNKRSVVPLNTTSEAFELFNRLLIPFVIDARGERCTGSTTFNRGRRVGRVSYPPSSGRYGNLPYM